MEFSRPEYCSGSLSLLQVIFWMWGSNPGAGSICHSAGRFLTSWVTREAWEYWSGQPTPSPGDLPNPGIKPGSLTLQVGSLPTELSGKSKGRRTRDQIANICWDIEKAVSEKHLLLLHWLHESLWLCGPQQTGKFLKRWEYHTTLPVSWEMCMQSRSENGLVQNWGKK